jgi:Spy/CpxP family protein refolding chaperone
MNRVRRLVTTILPAALAGGLLFGIAPGRASGDDGRGADADADADTDGDARRAPGKRTADSRGPRPLPPLPPAPPAPPAPPGTPVPPGGWHGHPPPLPGRPAGGRFSITIRNGKVHIEGLDGFAQHHLESVRRMILNNPDIPPAVRDKVLARLDRARSIVERRVRSLPATDADKLGDELEKMGDELEKAMEGLEEEMEQLGDKLGKDFAKKLGKDLAKGLRPGIRIHPGHDHDHDHDGDADDDHDGGDDDDGGDDGDDDDDDGDAAAGPDADARSSMRDLPDLTLQPAQRAQIVKLRAGYEQQITTARKQLDDASKRLEIAIADPKATDADIARYVDQVSLHEATIRKARLLTWVNARRLLDDAQRKKIEDAAGKRHR